MTDAEFREGDASTTGGDDSSATTQNDSPPPKTSSPTPAPAKGVRSWERRVDGQSPSLTRIEANWDVLEDIPGAELIKSNLSRQVISVPESSSGEPAVLAKRYAIRGKSEEWKYRFLPSRARREWDALRRLELAKFPVPKRYAMFEERDGKVLRSAGLVMEFLEDVYPLPDLIFADPSGEPARDQLLRSTGELVARLHAEGLAHPDLHLGNFLGDPDDSTDVRLVDLHAVLPRAVVSTPRRRTDLAKLVHSLGPTIDRHSLRQVLGGYLENQKQLEGDHFLGGLEEEIDLISLEARQLERVRLGSRDRRCWKSTTQFIREEKDGKTTHRRRTFSAEALSSILAGSASVVRTLRERSGLRITLQTVSTEEGERTVRVEERTRRGLRALTDRWVGGPLARAWQAARQFEVREIPHFEALAYHREKADSGLRTVLVTEWAEGRTLADFWRERGSQGASDEPEVRELIDSIAPILRQLHRSGVAPRHLGPDRWWIDSRQPGEPLTVRVLGLESVHPRHPSRLEERRRHLVELALFSEGALPLPIRRRFLVRYHDGERVLPAFRTAIEQDLAAAQIEKIERRVAAELGRDEAKAESSEAGPSEDRSGSGEPAH